jgi:hypothetical protein
MLPENWKNEIQEAIDKAARGNDEANQLAKEIQTKISAGVDAIANALNEQNEKHGREDSGKRSRETWTICALGAAAIFTLGLDVLSGCQLHEMQKVYGPIEKSADAARDSAEAAKKSAKVAEDTLIAGDRPWVGPETVDTVPLTVGGTFQATIRWRNTGRSPALQARIYTEGRKVDVGDPEPTRLTEFPAGVDTTLMMPNAVGATLIFYNSKINNQAAVDAVKNGTIKFWLVGLAEYKDVYGHIHTTIFRERYDPDVGAYRSVDGSAD